MKTVQKPGRHPDTLQANVETRNMASAELGKSFFYADLIYLPTSLLSFIQLHAGMLALANISQRAQWFLAKTHLFLFPVKTKIAKMFVKPTLYLPSQHF